MTTAPGTGPTPFHGRAQVPFVDEINDTAVTASDAIGVPGGPMGASAPPGRSVVEEGRGARTEFALMSMARLGQRRDALADLASVRLDW